MISTVMALRLNTIDGRPLQNIFLCSGNFFTGLSAFNNHIELIFCKSKQDIGDEFIGRSVVNPAHIKNVNADSFVE